jgi:hypothetical protein
MPAALLLLLCSLSAIPTGSAASAAPEWASIPIGGGGYVLQTYFHPVTNHSYMRTDVGGVYLRATAPSPLTPGVPYTWQPLLEWVSPADSEFFSASALALDPADGAVVYLLTGSYWAWSNCSVLASRDAGAHWSVTPAQQGWGLRCGGNEGDRAVGDRMAVHPALPGTIAVGGSDGRVHLTTSAFAAPAPPVAVALPPPAAPAPCQPAKNATCTVRTVLWLRPAPGTVLLLAAVPALGFFASPGPNYTDPASWSWVRGSDAPAEVNRVVAVPLQDGSVGGALWATAASGGVWRGTVAADGSGGWGVQWAVAGALAGAGVAFSGLALAPGGADVTAMAFAYNSNTTLWRSLDSGATWALQNWTMRSSVPWWGAYALALNAASSLSYEPAGAQGQPPLLWATDFFGVYYAPLPPAASSSSSVLAFTSAEAGHEEVCLNVLRAPAVGWPVSGSADVGGMVHSAGFGAYPPRTMAAHDGWAHNCLFDAAFTASASPSGASADALWVTAGDEYGSCHGAPSWCGLHSWVGVSRDGGATFADTAWDDVYAVDQANPYRVAVHPSDGARALVAARTGLPLTFTRDWGASWGNASGPGGATMQSCGQQGNFWFAQPLARENNDAAGAGAAAEATFYCAFCTSTVRARARARPLYPPCAPLPPLTRTRLSSSFLPLPPCRLQWHHHALYLARQRRHLCRHLQPVPALADAPLCPCHAAARRCRARGPLGLCGLEAVALHQWRGEL